MFKFTGNETKLRKKFSRVNIHGVNATRNEPWLLHGKLITPANSILFMPFLCDKLTIKSLFETDTLCNLTVNNGYKSYQFPM